MTIKDLFNGLNRNIDWYHFAHYLSQSATKLIQLKNPDRKFEFDDYNIDIIKNLYYYTIGSDKSKLDPNKGIFLGGKIGCGKTVLMKAYIDLLNTATGYYIETFSAPTLFEYYQKYGLVSLKLRPIMIDEVGREQLEIYVNGARIRPIEDLVALRYEYGALTFFTSNFKIETLSRGYDDKGKKIGYGEYIGDRIKDTCNIIVMPGKSRRE